MLILEPSVSVWWGGGGGMAVKLTLATRRSLPALAEPSAICLSVPYSRTASVA